MEQQCFSSLKNKKKQLLIFYKILWTSYSNGDTKYCKFVKKFSNKYSKFAAKKWCVIDSESKGVYFHKNPTEFVTKSLESSRCDYSDAYVLVTGNIAVVGAGDSTKIAFKN